MTFKWVLFNDFHSKWSNDKYNLYKTVEKEKFNWQGFIFPNSRKFMLNFIAEKKELTNSLMLMTAICAFSQHLKNICNMNNVPNVIRIKTILGHGITVG